MSHELEPGRLSLRAQDIQTGLQDYDVQEYKTLTELGWAARVAIHLRSAGPVPIDRLQRVSEHLFGANQWGFKEAIRILEDAEFIRVIGKGTSQTVVPQQIPYFDDMYPTLDEVADQRGLNELEVLSALLLDRLASSPVSRESIDESLGTEEQVLKRVIELGQHGSFIDRVSVGGEEIVISPLYFSENAHAFAGVVEKFGETAVKKVLDLLRSHPGWPLSLVEKGRFGTTRLKGVELDVARYLAQKAMTQPPGITAHGKTNLFLFTPRIGTKKIEIIEKEIYERAIEIIAAIRQGQHFEIWKIHSPVALLAALRDRRRLSPPASVRDQYVSLALRRIIRFDPPPPEPFQDVVFIPEPENIKAINLAIDILRGSGLESARPAQKIVTDVLTSDTAYLEFIRGAGRIRTRQLVPTTGKEASEELNRLIEICSKGF